MTQRTALVATDLSETADLALAAAIQWAEHLGTAIRLVHVLDAWQDTVEEAGARLCERVRRVNHAGVDCWAELISRCGKAPEPSPLLSCAADWLFLGAARRAGPGDLAAGSWVEALIRGARTPVVSVPDGARIEKDMSTIVVGLDGSSQSALVFEQLQKTGAALGCSRMVLVHAHTAPALEPGLAATLDTLLASARTAGYCADLVTAAEGSAGLLLRVAEQESAGLIGVGTHSKRGFPQLLFGSVARAVIRGARCPVYTARLATRSRKRD